MLKIPDALILIVYVACVWFVIDQAIKALDKQFAVRIDQSLIDQQLQDYGLQKMMAVKFGFKPRYAYDALKDFSVTVQNKSDRYFIHVNWDQSVVTDVGGMSKRVVRVPSDLSVSLWQIQPTSVVDSGKSIQATVVAEDSLKRTAENGPFEVAKALFNAGKLDELPSLSFSLRLAMQFVEYGSNLSNPASQPFYLLCRFELIKLPWTAFFSWNKK